MGMKMLYTFNTDNGDPRFAGHTFEVFRGYWSAKYNEWRKAADQEDESLDLIFYHPFDGKLERLIRPLEHGVLILKEDPHKYSLKVDSVISKVLIEALRLKEVNMVGADDMDSDPYTSLGGKHIVTIVVYFDGRTKYFRIGLNTEEIDQMLFDPTETYIKQIKDYIRGNVNQNSITKFIKEHP